MIELTDVYHENIMSSERVEGNAHLKSGDYYGKPAWPGTICLWCRGILPERCLYICHARTTDTHAVPVPKVFVPIEEGLRLEVDEWTAHLESGEKVHLPSQDNRLAGVIGWTLCSIRSSLVPGQFVMVKSNYSHRLIGEGQIAMLYVPPDSPEGQGLVTRDDYETGIAIIAPPTSEANDVPRLLSSLCGKQWKGAKEAATEVYDKIVAHLEGSNPQVIVPDWLVSIAKSVRNRCRLKRYQCELNARIRRRDLVRYVRRTTNALEKIMPKTLERVFREYLMTRVCPYVRFLHHAAAMQYYAAAQRRAWREDKDLDITITELAAEVHYLDSSQFTRDFHGFHGIAPVMFFPNTHFILLEMEPN